MKNIIFIGGIHGVGKGTICNEIAFKTGSIHLTASEIASLSWESTQENSIKEQQAQIEALQKVIQGLETKLKAYENKESTELAVIRAEIKKLSDAIGMEANAEKKK